MAEFWTFLGDPHNQATLTFVGGGLVALASGAWAVIKFFARPKGEDGAAPPPGRTTIRADQDGVAGGRDVRVRTSHGLSGLQALLLAGVVVGAVLLAGGLLGQRITATDCGIAVGRDANRSTITADCPAQAGK
jgi:hypothetical protein